VSVHGPQRPYFEPLKLLMFDFNPDPDSDQAFHSNADPDAASINNADPIRNPALPNSTYSQSKNSFGPKCTCSQAFRRNEQIGLQFKKCFCSNAAKNVSRNFHKYSSNFYDMFLP